MRPAPKPRRPEQLAILPLRNSVLFPMSVVPINVGRPRSVRLVEELLGQESAMVGVLTQKNSETVEPTFEDLYAIGTLARVVKVIRLGPSNYSVVLNGLGRFRMQATSGLEPYMTAEVERISETSEPRARPASTGSEAAREHARSVGFDAEPAEGDRKHPRQRARARRPGGFDRFELSRKSKPASTCDSACSRPSTCRHASSWSWPWSRGSSRC